MKTIWSKGLDPDQVKELKAEFIRFKPLRNRLQEICGEKEASCNKASINKDGYDCPNWAYKQADAVGYRRALHEIISLIK